MVGNRFLFLKKAPALKLLPAMMAGILIQWHFKPDHIIAPVLCFLGIGLLLLFSFIPLFKKYKLSVLSGISIFLIFFSIGAILVQVNDIRNNQDWIGNKYQSRDGIVASLTEPLSEKTKSYKANAKIDFLIDNGNRLSANGNIIIYFKKDSTPINLEYGSQILFKKSLQEIQNSGNPNGFDYKRYALFQGITHQVFLKTEEYEILPTKKQTLLNNFLFSTREKVLSTLRTYIPGSKEKGLAEALLIGYKNDLDQALVQSYTNTGVVHIIAISGLHLGLIYWLLSLLTQPLKRKKHTKWIVPIIIILCLWIFSLLAGAQASIIRSAVMFTCVVLGQAIGRKNNSIYNTLALSALMLLCINPFWLWDVGFQLSYAAVLSIVIFMRPIYHWFYFENKIVDFIWKLNAVTIAAQILTVPLSIYHFHQFPNYFMLTNFIAVPLSSLILLGEILLCAVAYIPAVALWVGKLLYVLIWLMNTWIEKIESLRFSLWDGLYIDVFQMVLLFFSITGISLWLMNQQKRSLIFGLSFLLCFIVLRTFSFQAASMQQKIIVYNIPQKKAIDIIDGRHYQFMGDTDLLDDAFLQNFHLKPSRTFYRISSSETNTDISTKKSFIKLANARIMMIDSSLHFIPTSEKSPIDLLVISKNPKLYFTQLHKSFNIKQVVFDGSCPSWKVKYWKKDCDSLNIPWYDVTEKGAFVMNF